MKEEYELFTPKFVEFDRDENDEGEVVKKMQVEDAHKVELLCEIIQRKNVIIFRTQEQLKELHDKYERLSKENNVLTRDIRQLSSQMGKQERSNSRDARRSQATRIDEGSAEEDKEEALRQNLMRYNRIREDQHLRSSKWSRRMSFENVDPDPKPHFTASSIKQNNQQTITSKNSLNLSSIKTPGANHLQSLRTRLSIHDDSQLVSQLHDIIDSNAQSQAFFDVLHKAAVDLTPDREKAAISKQPKELWRWLKSIFSRYMQLKEQTSAGDRAWLARLLDLLKADSKEEVVPSIEDLLQIAEVGMLLARHTARIFSLNKTTPEEILHCIESIDKAVHDYR